MKKILALALVVCVVGTVTGVATAESIKIGLMGPMTGSWASEGQEMKQVVELLAEEFNAKGGVLGKKIEVISEDDGGDPRTAALGGTATGDPGSRRGHRHLRFSGDRSHPEHLQ